MDRLTFIDLFAGCGGFSAGLENAGLKGVLHLEKDEWACDTLRANFDPTTVLCADIRAITDDFIESYRGVDVLVGGPPCQGFSVAGGSQFGVLDPRNELVSWFLHWAEVIQPRAIIIENVPQIFTKKDKQGLTVTDVVRSKLEPLGYSVNPRILCAADYGVPQIRNRAFIISSKLPHDISFPKPTHSSQTLFGDRDLFKADLLPYVTVGDALADLPLVEAGQGQDEIVPYQKQASDSKYRKMMRLNSGGVANHIAMKHTSRLIDRFAQIKPNQSLKDVAAEYGQLVNRSGQTSETPFKYNNYRLNAEHPSLTIPASFQSLFLHPRLNRNLTAREAARLMSFPDRFTFKGKRTTMSWEKHLSQYNQIGNAVCPLVASAIGDSLVENLGKGTGFRHKGIIGVNTQNTVSSEVTPKIAVDDLEMILGTFLSSMSGVPNELSAKWINRGGLKIPTVALPIAILMATENVCRHCDLNTPPHGKHNGSIPFLISKDSTDSLIANGKDNGLDYHLRSVLGVEFQIAHFVGEELARLGFCNLSDVENPRTGRKVRGVQNVKCPVWLEMWREIVSKKNTLVSLAS